jgi:hypothetical protein
MAKRLQNSVRTTTKLSLRNALVYGSLGLLTGASLCVVVMLIGPRRDIEKSKREIKTITLQPVTICSGGDVQLQPNGLVGDVFIWSPTEGLSNPHIPNPIASPQLTTVYNATIYKKTNTIFATSELLPVTSTELNGKVKGRMMWRKRNEVEPNTSYLITLTARTTQFLDNALIQLRVNNEAYETFAIESGKSSTLETVWTNADETEANITLHLLNYDGDADAIEFDKITMHQVERTDAKIEVRIDKSCEACARPAMPKAVNVNMHEVKLQWNEINSKSLLVRYKQVGDDEDWIYVNSKGKTVQLNALSSDNDYVAQAASICKNDTSNWTAPINLRSIDRQLTSSR